MEHLHEDYDENKPGTPPPLHPSADPRDGVDCYRPQVHPDESIPLLIDMDTHISSRIKCGESLPRFKGICGGMNNIREWYASLNDNVKENIRNAGFKIFVLSLMRTPCELSVVQSVAERWLDTPHTFVFKDFEATITSTDFSGITGIEMGGEPIQFDIGG